MNLKIKNKKSVLCIVAHPDDEALGLGGTLIKHVQNGDRVDIVIFSNGEDSKLGKNINSERRLKSARNLSKKVCSNLYELLNYPDQKLDTIPKL